MKQCICGWKQFIVNEKTGKFSGDGDLDVVCKELGLYACPKCGLVYHED